MKNLKKTNMLKYQLETEEYESQIETIQNELKSLQRKIALDKKVGIVILLQGVDASGKDGIIKHVLSSLSRSSSSIKAFTRPTKEELSHDYLWRINKELPSLGNIKIFNRSHYEDVIVPKINNKNFSTSQRLKEIRGFEKYLKNNNIVVLKFFLHISKEEQYKRLKERESDPTKKWKVDKKDWIIQQKWDEVMNVYEQILQNTTDWNIIPTNHKKTARLMVGKKIVKELKKIIS